MLIDKVTNKSYSSRAVALRDLGKTLFDKKVKKGEIEYIETKYVHE